jgi:hypothetical protein
MYLAFKAGGHLLPFAVIRFSALFHLHNLVRVVLVFANSESVYIPEGLLHFLGRFYAM